MKNDPARILQAAVLSALALAFSAQADIVHRYSFSEQPEATTTKDSVGTADGVIKGTGAYFDGVGHLSLPGGPLSNVDDPPATTSTISGYVDLPNHIINVLSNATFETWVTWEGSGAWQRIFDFGTSQGAEGLSSGNGNYIFLSPQGDVNIRFALRDPATGAEPVQATANAKLETGTEVCLAVTYDYAANTTRLFSNGVVIATAPASVALSALNDVNNWLGRSQWGDSMFQGTYNEFRIYDTALNPLQVAASAVSGPDTPSTDIALLGALEGVHLIVVKTNMTQLDTQSTSVKADYAKMPGLALAGVAGVTYESDKPEVLTVSDTGLLTAKAGGNAKVTVSFGGKSDSVTIQVAQRVADLVVAGTLYVDLRASDAKTDVTVWPNRTGKGDFTAAGTPVYEANVAGTGIAGVTFNGSTDAYTGPNTTADLEVASDRSIEVWAYNPNPDAEETLVSWGHRGGSPDRSNMSFNYGTDGGYGAVGHWGDDLGWKEVPATAQWHYLVYTYDGADTIKVYSDGVFKNQKTLGGPLATFAEQPIRLAAQANSSGSDFDFGQALSGSIALVRVHGGTLSDVDIANNYLYGIELTAPGELQGITLSFGSTTFAGPRDYTPAKVTAHYANRNYLSVTALSTFESSDTNVATVDKTGKVVAVKEGSAVITATYQGKQNSQTVNVVAPPATVLRHRYSFNETSGTTVKDSVGTADGVLKGNGAAFDGAGKVSVNGGTLSSADAATISGYVDLPNHIINVLDNATFEVWTTWDGTGSWQRIFDLGTSGDGEDVSNGNGNYLFLSPQGDANIRFSVRDPATGGEPAAVTAAAPLAAGTEAYLAVTYNFNANVALVYSNAVVVATNTAPVALKTIDDVNNWLGRSQWGDNMYQGSYNEFRIWEGAFSSEDVAASYASGPNTLPMLTVRPTLTVAVSGGKVVIAWPSAATGFALQSTPALGAATVWTAVDTSAATETGGQTKLAVTPDGPGLFYRLKK